MSIPYLGNVPRAVADYVVVDLETTGPVALGRSIRIIVMLLVARIGMTACK